MLCNRGAVQRIYNKVAYVVYHLLKFSCDTPTRIKFKTLTLPCHASKNSTALQLQGTSACPLWGLNLFQCPGFSVDEYYHWLPFVLCLHLDLNFSICYHLDHCSTCTNEHLYLEFQVMNVLHTLKKIKILNQKVVYLEAPMHMNAGDGKLCFGKCDCYQGQELLLGKQEKTICWYSISTEIWNSIQKTICISQEN